MGAGGRGWQEPHAVGGPGQPPASRSPVGWVGPGSPWPAGATWGGRDQAAAGSPWPEGAVRGGWDWAAPGQQEPHREGGSRLPRTALSHGRPQATPNPGSPTPPRAALNCGQPRAALSCGRSQATVSRGGPEPPRTTAAASRSSPEPHLTSQRRAGVPGPRTGRTLGAAFKGYTNL